MTKNNRVIKIRARGNNFTRFHGVLMSYLKGAKQCKRGVKRVNSKAVRWNIKADWT